MFRNPSMHCSIALSLGHLQVNEQQLQKQLDEITVIIKVRENLNAKVPVSEASHAPSGGLWVS